MRFLFAFVFSIICNLLSAQATNELDLINKQVWFPFISAFQNLDEEGFLSLHYKNMIRLNMDEDIKSDYDTYFQSQKDHNDYYRKSQKKKLLELRFLHRSIHESFAYEMGYYKSSDYDLNKKEQFDYYGKFNIILKKEMGVWKIYMDADHGGVSEQEFLSAKSLNN